MTKQISNALLLVSLLFSTQSFAQNLKDAYIDTNKKTFKKEFNHLAIMPLQVAPTVKPPETIRQLIITEITNKFIKSNFNLLPTEKITAIENQFKNLYPNNLNDKQNTTITEHTQRELFFQYNVDGTLTIQILAVGAPFSKDKAVWGGTSQKIKHRGDGLFSKGYEGYTSASAIRVIVADRSGKVAYRWEGGIEVMKSRNGTKFEDLPKESLWQNEKRIRNAIKYVLKPL